MTTRVFRAGGLTKDAIYLNGVVEVLDYLRTGGDLPTLWIGKIGVGDLFLMNELRIRRVVAAPVLLPRFLNEECFRRQYERLSKCESPLDLLDRH